MVLRCLFYRKEEDMTNSYIALDLETTGLEARLDKITDAFANLKKAFAADPKMKDVARIDGDVTDLLQQLEEEEKEKAKEPGQTEGDSDAVAAQATEPSRAEVKRNKERSEEGNNDKKEDDHENETK